MKRNNAPSAFDLIFLVVAPLTAIRGTVKLTQSDGDLAAHIRMGETILATGHIPAHSLVSFTAPSDYMVAHAWLSEIIFTTLFRIGGLPLLSVVTGILVGLTHGAIALFLRKRGADPRWAFLAALLSLSLGSTHWLTRPHMFSIAFSAATLILLESKIRRRVLWFVPLFALWANLHGGWAYGLLLIAMYIAGDLIEAFASSTDRSAWITAAKENSAAFAAASAATFLNPYGIRLHEEVFSAVTSSSLASQIAEYLPPNFQDAGQWPFLLAILATVALFAFGTKRIRIPWLLVITMSLFFALRSFRNIALFGVTAWPLVALHVAESWPRPKKPFRFFSEFARLDPGSRKGILAVPVAALMLLVGVNHGAIAGVQVIADSFSPKKFPVEAIARASAARLDGRVFDTWGWGGYIMYAWPEARLHVDPLKFNETTIKSYGIIEDLQPGWQKEIQRWQIKTVIVHSRSPTAKGLALEPGWKVWYKDSIATIFRPAGNPST
ncbi:MAG TPA: hypothetical protein VF042_11195 [Gemmatimonadaceae bacterium]